MHKWLGKLIVLLIMLVPGIINAAADLYFSEYIEGSSFNKALEIYNNTGASVDLSDYEVRFYFNGSTSPGRNINLVGTLADGDVYVLADNNASEVIISVADLLSGTNWFNGDDAIELVNAGSTIDVIGQIGVDPGSQWGSGISSTQNNTLRRKATVDNGDANGFDLFEPATEWDGFAQDSFEDLGVHAESDIGPISQCGDPATLIHEIQGIGGASPLEGEAVTIEAVVTADFQSTLQGIFLQEEDDQIDDNIASSEGIFVFTSNVRSVNIGDRVRVTGRVQEFFDLTELSSITSFEVCANSVNVTPAILELPFADLQQAESYEGMLVVITQTLTVSENFNLGRFGDVLLSNGRLYQPTHLSAPGEAALHLATQNALNQITLDDASNSQNPDPILFPAPELTASNTLRAGDTVSGLQGVMYFSFGKYKVLPTTAPQFAAYNPRPETLPVPATGEIRIASFNVLNYFTSLDNAGAVCGPDGNLGCRGADTELEFQRQQVKIVNAIVDLNADVIGVMEIENNGYDAQSAIANLVAAINAQTTQTNSSNNGVEYAYIDPGLTSIGSDAIAVGIIYNINKVVPIGEVAILDSSVDHRFIDTRNRPTLAASFKDFESHQKFTIAVNHFKSKGSACDDIGDPDSGDGQGNCNVTRTQAAYALVDWLASYPTGINDPDVLIIGDLNAYAKEDPINAIKAGGYLNLIESYAGDDAYSFVFFGQAGYLDHALVSEQVTEQVTDVQLWHINADEPNVLNYNQEFKSASQQLSLYSPDPYRASDHDPVVIDLKLLAPCDLDSDGDLNREDITLFLNAFKSRHGEPDYLRRADMDRNGIVDIKDLKPFFRCFAGNR